MKPGPKPKTPYERMMKKVEKQENGCWLFKGSLNKNGHGNVQVWNGKKWANKNAHAVSAEYHKGVKLPRGKVWRHTCDVYNCVNPDHLIPGTYQQNTHDMINRGRHNGCVKPKKNYYETTDDECPF